jgi:hypothetical protein
MITPIEPGPNFKVAYGDCQLIPEIVDIGLGGNIVMDRVIDFRRYPLRIGALQACTLESARVRVNRSAVSSYPSACATNYVG